MRRRLQAAAALVLVLATGASASAGPTPGEVYRVWLDGRRLDLTASPADDFAPAVSPDGRRLAFVSDRGGLGAHLYVVGSDGRGLRQISSPLPTGQSLDGQIAWSPDSRQLVIAASALLLIRPGSRQRPVASASNILAPAWSPHARLIAFRAGGSPKPQVRAVTPTGRLVLRVRGAKLGWSPKGRLAVIAPSNGEAPAEIRIYDEDGRRRASFPGRSFAWSTDGTRLASVTSDRLEVHSLRGRLEFRKAVPGLPRSQHNGLVWAGRNRVVIGGTGGSQSTRALAVDIRTGRISTGNNRYFGTLSPDRKLVAGITLVGRTAALTVSRLDGSDARTLVRRSHCPDLVEAAVEWLPDGRSLVYDFKCQSTAKNP